MFIIRPALLFIRLGKNSEKSLFYSVSFGVKEKRQKNILPKMCVGGCTPIKNFVFQSNLDYLKVFRCERYPSIQSLLVCFPK